MKRLAFYLILILLTLGCIELIAFAYFSFKKDRFTFSDNSSYVLTEEQLNLALHKFDASLGWTEKYDTPFGERPDERIFPDTLIATFGDSFTNCVGVEDDETWQYHLATRLNSKVYNFGIGGFGMGQTLLNFRENFKKIKTPIVTYGFTGENLARAVNVYRPFYFKKTGVTMTKPRYTLENGELLLLPNPIQEKSDLDNLQVPNFFIKIGENDYWYNRHNLPHFKFPFTAIFFHESYQHELTNGKYDDLKASNKELWKEEAYAQLGFAMFDAFVEEAEAQGAIPIIMHIPLKFEVDNYRAKKMSRRLEIYKTYCESKNYNFFDGTEVMGSYLVENNKKHKDIYHHHINKNGTKVFADGFYEYLLTKGLVE